MSTDTPGAPADTKSAGKGKARRSLLRRMIRSVVRVSIVTYVGLMVLMASCQSRLVYHPARDLDGSPKDVGLAYEDVRFSTADGVDLHGWFVPAADADRTVLFCHGNAGNISHRVYSIATFHDLGCNVFIFDYRGYGLSDGSPTEEGSYLDADAAWDYLTGERKIPPERIVVFGRSLGGAIAANLASRRTPAKLILESTFSSAADIASAHFWYLPIRLFLRFDYDTVNAVSGVHCPVLVVHSLDDQTIPIALGRKVFDAANEPKTFLEINGGHNEGFFVSQSMYRRGLRSFLGGAIIPGDSHGETVTDNSAAD